MFRFATHAFIYCVVATAVQSQNIQERCVPDGNTAYFVSNTELNFDLAKKYCEKMNARLVTLNNATKSAIVYNILKQRDANESSRFYWIGAKDVGFNLDIIDGCKGRNFVWLDINKCVSRYNTDWCTDEPNREYEKCVDVEPSDTSYCWADVDCSFERYFICERPPQKSIFGIPIGK